MKGINPRPDIIELETNLNGKNISEKVEYFLNNFSNINHRIAKDLVGEDFYAWAMASYKLNNSYKNEIEFALHQWNHLKEVVEKIKSKPDSHEKPFIPLYEFNIQYFETKLTQLKKEIENGKNKNEYSEFVLHQINEIANPQSNLMTNNLKLNWNGNKNVLIDIFYQLKRIKGKDNNFLITNSNEEISQFLKENFDCFANTKLSTIMGQLKSSQRPNKRSIDMKE